MLYVNARSQVNKREYKKKQTNKIKTHMRNLEDLFRILYEEKRKNQNRKKLLMFLAATVVFIYACTLWGKKRINKINNIKPF